MDLFIHKHFFNLPWHVAFVFDPQNQEEGLFAWRSANMAIESFVVQKDMPPIGQKVARRVPEPYSPPVQYATDGGNGSVPGVAALTQVNALAPTETSAVSQPNLNVPPSVRPAATAEVNELSARIQILEKRQRWVTAALALAVLVAVAWPIVLSALAILRPTSEEQQPAGIPPNVVQPEQAQAPKNPAGAAARSTDNPRTASAGQQ
jgi:hypothetical protein